MNCPSMELNTRLQKIVQKLERLQNKLQAMDAENDRLRAVNQTLKQQLETQQKAVEKAGHNISEHAPVSKEKKQKEVRAALDQDIRQQIDHYLKEIDKCIEWLGQQ